MTWEPEAVLCLWRWPGWPWKGHVWAVEKNPAAVELLKKNKKKIPGRTT